MKVIMFWMYHHRVAWLLRFGFFSMLCAVCFSVRAQDIVAFNNGVITWTNAYVDGNWTIEWATDIDGEWHSDWKGLKAQPVVGLVMTVFIG